MTTLDLKDIAHEMTECELTHTYSMLVRYINGDCKGNDRVGICADILGEDFPREVKQAWAGKRDCIFPIEGDFIGYVSNVRKHDRRTTYGKQRLAMAKFCLEWVEGQLAKALNDEQID
jgi:hypothetical protein